ncbi:hypothetical protein [Curtobacterium sp. VKM Ac-2852]|uniref:hypothetical protein n=1 Tax=Curtobacterium sp. VKM Ac-2852 TaxID=2739024 RepID=UPI001566D1A3|nr:hypothetical protein [Curtobacterium sp. VKM Ac-2852]NQX25677.1 hypothetical protein [Curtobacterium sp. VKM Ac-2852]
MKNSVGCRRELHGVPHSTRLAALNETEPVERARRASSLAVKARQKANRLAPAAGEPDANQEPWQIAISDFVGARVTEGLIDAWTGDDPLGAVKVLRSVVSASTSSLAESIADHIMNLGADDEDEWPEDTKRRVSDWFAEEHVFCALIAGVLQIHDIGTEKVTEVVGDRIGDLVLEAAIPLLGDEVPAVVRAAIRSALRAAASAAVAAIANPQTIMALRVAGVWLCPNIPAHPTDPQDGLEPGENLVDVHCVKKLESAILSQWIKDQIDGWVAESVPTDKQHDRIVARAAR